MRDLLDQKMQPQAKCVESDESKIKAGALKLCPVSLVMVRWWWGGEGVDDGGVVMMLVGW